MSELSGEGVSIDVPPGWDGRIFRRPAHGEVAPADAGPTAPPGATTHAVVHVSNVPIPPGVGDFGSGVVETLGPGAAFIALFEYAPESATVPLFEAEGLPRALDPEEFGRDVLQRTLPRQAGLQRFFHDAGRAFCLYVVLGRYRRRNEVVPAVNAVLETIRIEPLAVAAEDPVPERAGSGPLLDVVTADPELSALASLLPGTGVDEALRGLGPLTLFAPRDAAFAAFGGTDELRADAGLRARVLMYHLARELVPVGGLADGRHVTTVLGPPLALDVATGRITVNGATVVRADVEASNGLVDVVDAVLVPPEEPA